MINKKIQKLIQSGKLPILAFEHEVLVEQLRELDQKQSVLGQNLGDAMRQSTETWHDNAPAESIESESRVLASLAEKLFEQKNNSVIIDTSAKNDHITLGSVVVIENLASGKKQRLLLVGVVAKLPKKVREMVGGAVPVTLQSPIGQAIFNRQVGEVVSFSLKNDKGLSFKIVEVEKSLL